MKVSGSLVIISLTVLLAIVAIPVMMKPPARGDIVMAFAKAEYEQRLTEAEKQRQRQQQQQQQQQVDSSTISSVESAVVRTVAIYEPPVPPLAPPSGPYAAPPSIDIPPSLKDWPVGVALATSPQGPRITAPPPRAALPESRTEFYRRPVSFSAHFLNRLEPLPHCSPFIAGASPAPCEKRMSFRGEFTDDLMVILPTWWKSHRYNCCSTAMDAPGDGDPFYFFGAFRSAPGRRGYVRFTDPLSNFPDAVWEPPPLRAHYENDYFRFDASGHLMPPTLSSDGSAATNVDYYNNDDARTATPETAAAAAASKGYSLAPHAAASRALSPVITHDGSVTWRRAGEKPIWVMTNKLNREWSHEPFNYLDLPTLTTALQIIARRYTPVYIRHTAKVVDMDKQDFYDIGEHDVLRSAPFRALGVVLIDDLFDAVKDYNISFNSLQLMVLANAERYSSVQGGNCVLTSYWGKTNVVYVRYGPEIGPKGGYFTLYKRISGATVIPTHWYDDYIVETLRIVEPYFATRSKAECLEWVRSMYPAYRARRDETLGGLDGLTTKYIGGWYERHNRINMTA